MNREARGTAAQRGYDGKWQAYREKYLRGNPWCLFHLRTGKRVRATVVDHVTPHRGNRKLFWDPANHQGLCADCHNSVKKRIENGGPTRLGCDANGAPLDRSHHWSTS